jgi:hypothetical protein
MYGCVSKGGTHGSGGAVGPIEGVRHEGVRERAWEGESSRTRKTAVSWKKLCQRDGASRPYDSSGTHGTWHRWQNYL